MGKKKVKPMRWTKEEIKILKALLKEGNHTYEELSRMLLVKYKKDRSPEAIRKFIKRNDIVVLTKNQRKLSKLTKEKSNIPEINDVKVDNDTNKVFMLWDEMDKLVGVKHSIQKAITERFEGVGAPKGKLHKVVSISDLHIPWVNENVISDMLSKHSDADTLVINGDLLDQYSVSKWSKEKQILLQHEYEMAMEYLLEFSKTFKNIVLTRGNHDSRLQSKFANELDPNVMFMVNPDMLDRLKNGYVYDHKRSKLVKKYNFNNIHYAGGLSGWYAKVGNCIFAHPKSGSKIPMRMATNTADYFLEKEDYDAIVIGHTHKIGKIVWKGKLLIEQGCCCLPMDYEADAAMKYSQQAFGYCVMYMNAKGEVDFNKSTPVYTGTATALDTEVRLNVE
jgi:predicted phosphodiesterase